VLYYIKLLMGLLYHGKFERFVYVSDMLHIRFRCSFCNTLLAK